MKTLEDYKSLAEKVELKAESSYVTDCLLTKANKSDLDKFSAAKHQGSVSKCNFPLIQLINSLATLWHRSCFEKFQILKVIVFLYICSATTSHNTTRVLVDQLREQTLRIGQKVDTAHCQVQGLAQVQAQMQSMLGKLEAQSHKFALVSEVNKCLESKANKVAVATALHRKANKESVAQSFHILESKVEHSNPSLNLEAVTCAVEAVEKQLKHVEKKVCKNASTLEGLPSVDKVSTALSRLHLVLEKQMEAVKSQLAIELARKTSESKTEFDHKMASQVSQENDDNGDDVFGTMPTSGDENTVDALVRFYES